MATLSIGDRVIVRIGQTNSPTVAYVPGICVDARIMDRPLMTTRRGLMTVQNSAVVISLRQNQTPGNGRPDFYWVSRPENVIALSPRTVLVPAIDGAEGMSFTTLKPILEAAVAQSAAALNPAPEFSAIEQAMGAFAAAPALVPVANR
jgi:hypothetical protein